MAKQKMVFLNPEDCRGCTGLKPGDAPVNPEVQPVAGLPSCTCTYPERVDSHREGATHTHECRGCRQVWVFRCKEGGNPYHGWLWADPQWPIS